MSLIVPSYTDPQDPTTPATDVCAWIAVVTFLNTGGESWIRVFVHRTVDASNAVPLPDPLDQFAVMAGEVLVPAVEADPDADPPIEAAPAITFPAKAQVIAEAFAAQQANSGLDPEQAIGLVLQTHLLNHPKLQGATMAQ